MEFGKQLFNTINKTKNYFYRGWVHKGNLGFPYFR